MRIESQPAFVLHTRPWRETSVMVELLTRDHGRVTVVARGLTGPKKSVQRAALQPLQCVRVDYLPRGELARLIQAEAVDTAPALSGESLMAAFYVNELLLRLCARQDAVPSVFGLYARVRAELAGGGSLAWTLRRFERDLLDALGYGLPWSSTEDGERLEPASSYRYVHICR
jgi:DNA repair protein RecO (recombination protein O)